MKLRFASLVLVLATAGCATAAGSEEGGDAAPATSKDGGAAKDSGTPAKKDAGSPTTNDSGPVQTDDSGAPPDDSTCSSQTTKNQCEQCCLTVHPSGYAVYQQQLDDCVCNSPAACATECANEVCANQPTTPNDACSTCISNSLTSNGACYQAVANACQADTDCTTLFGTCIPPCEQMQ